MGLTLVIVGAACSPNIDAVNPSTEQTLNGAFQPVQDEPTVVPATPTTGAIAPIGRPVSIAPDLPLGGPVPAGAPDVVAERVPLPYCGATLLVPAGSVHPFMEIEISGDADDCYRSRANRGLPAELIEISFTIEGDPLLMIRRLLSDGREEVFSDLTRDAFGRQAWFHRVCSGYDMEQCQAAEELTPAGRAPPESTLFEIATDSDEAGPPFFVTADGVTATRDDAWATQQVTVVSEWQTTIAITPPPTRYVLDSRRAFRPSDDAAVRQPVIIEPGASASFLLTLKPRLPAGPVPGTYEIEVPITFWRDVDAVAGPTGPPENTLILKIKYQILDARTASAIRAFCDQALAAATDLTELDQERLDRGLESIEGAAELLPLFQREQLLMETERLRLQLEQWFGPMPGHSGFSTTGVIWLINRLCGTDLPAMSVQA